jgi:hypothetical protein
MMEQLAERRMQREEEAQYAAQGMRHPLSSGHNHPPLDEEDYEDEDDEEYASEDDEDYEDDEMVSCLILGEFADVFFRRVCRKSNEWKKVEGCSKYLQLECLNSAC